VEHLGECQGVSPTREAFEAIRRGVASQRYDSQFFWAIDVFVHREASAAPLRPMLLLDCLEAFGEMARNVWQTESYGRDGQPERADQAAERVRLQTRRVAKLAQRVAKLGPHASPGFGRRLGTGQPPKNELKWQLERTKEVLHELLEPTS
jgi:hypothetical protein